MMNFAITKPCFDFLICVPQFILFEYWESIETFGMTDISIIGEVGK